MVKLFTRSVPLFALAVFALGFTGTAADAKEREIDPSDLPSAVRAAVEAAIPGGQIVEAEVETENGKEVYEVEVEADGKEFEVEVTASGEVLEIEEEDGDDDDGEDDDDEDDDDEDDDDDDDDDDD